VVPRNPNFSSPVLDCAFAATPAQTNSSIYLYDSFSQSLFPLSLLSLVPHPYISHVCCVSAIQNSVCVFMFMYLGVRGVHFPISDFGETWKSPTCFFVPGIAPPCPHCFSVPGVYSPQTDFRVYLFHNSKTRNPKIPPRAQTIFGSVTEGTTYLLKIGSILPGIICQQVV
jgi:hypothetical protein